jgi:hypothetical protein
MHTSFCDSNAHFSLCADFLNNFHTLLSDVSNMERELSLVAFSFIFVKRNKFKCDMFPFIMATARIVS